MVQIIAIMNRNNTVRVFPFQLIGLYKVHNYSLSSLLLLFCHLELHVAF